MSILLSLLLAQARVLPEIDRRALDLQARSEALQSRSRTAHSTATPRATAQAAPRRTAPVIRAVQTQPQRMPNVRRASGGALDLSSITTICRAAGNQADPATFLSTLSRAYSLSPTESTSLRTSCAAYLAGRADARVNSYDISAR